MNVLFLSIDVPPGSKRDHIIYNFITKEMKYLQAKGHKIYYLSNFLKKNVVKDDIYYLSKDALLEKNTIIRRSYNLFFCLRHFWFFKPLSLFVKNIRQILHICGVERACIKAIKKFNIDIIHTHFFVPNGEAAVLSAKACKIPIVATLRGAELHSMPQFDYGACRSKFYKTMLQKSLKYIDYITAPNRSLCRKLQLDFGVPKEKIEYLPNGVEKISFIKNISNTNREINFICICSMIKRKNLDIIFASLKELLKEFEFKIFIVGSGPLRQRYEKIIKISSLNNILINDEIPKNDLFKLISTCDCLINPSFCEGMPNVVLESLAIGIPCLVSDIPGHHELIEEGINSFFFDPYDINSFISKMRYILSNKDILGRMRDNCINSVKKYSIEIKIDRYIEIYTKLTSTFRPFQ